MCYQDDTALGFRVSWKSSLPLSCAPVILVVIVIFFFFFGCRRRRRHRMEDFPVGPSRVLARLVGSRIGKFEKGREHRFSLLFPQKEGKCVSAVMDMLTNTLTSGDGCADWQH